MIGTSLADEGKVPRFGVPRLDHVFVIMMENHGCQEVIGNPYMPFLNAERRARISRPATLWSPTPREAARMTKCELTHARDIILTHSVG
jgi:hypothetical protein